MEHFDKMIEFYGPHGVPMFRKHTHTYSKGYRGASALRNSVNSISEIQEYRAVIDDFFRNSEQIF
jgi:tRNA-dihydrouridine synthase B